MELASDVIAPALAKLRAAFPGLAITLSAQSGQTGLPRPRRPHAGTDRIQAVRSGERGSVAAGRLVLHRQRRGSRARPHQRWLERFAGDRTIMFCSSDVHARLAAARQGIGVAALPHFVAAGDPVLVEIASDPIPARTIWLVLHADLRRAPAVRAAAEHLIAIFAAHPGFWDQPHGDGR